MRGLPWRWIVPVLLILALGQTVRLYAGALGRADAARTLARDLTTELAGVQESNATLEEALQEADLSKAAQAREDSVSLAALALETEELSRTVRDLAVADRQNAESVDVALRDLGAVLSPGAVPALRQLQGAYEARITGLSGQVVALSDIVEAKDEEIGILEREIVSERGARSAADALLEGLRSELRVQADLVDTQEIEIDALRDAVAPGFFLRLGQNVKLALGAAVFGGAVTYLVVGS